MERLRRLIAAFFLISTLLPAFTATAYADFGPKPSVVITTADLPESICYGTLLAAVESYARWHAVDEPIGTERGETYARAYNTFLDEPIESGRGETYDRAYNSFLEYAAQDDYYFWGRMFEIKDGHFSWTYYPPEKFKVLLYDTDKDMLYVGEEAERYALDSIYKASIHPDGTVRLSKTPYILENILNFCVRLVYTVTVEVLIAFIFGYRKKKEILIILVVNLFTQFCLNLLLSFSDYFLDTLVWGLLFPLLELAIIIGEAIAYAHCLKSHSRKRAVLYAIAANVITLLSGVLIIFLL